MSALWLPAPVWAQVATTFGLASDYRLRGLSLTDRNPALILSLAYDHPSGAYAGGTMVALADAQSAHLVGTTEYAGFTHPLGGDLLLDAGASYQDYTLYFERRSKLRYAEFYLGVIWRDLSGHLYFKPNNPRDGVNSAYGDVNWSLRPARDWRISAHLGANERLNGTAERDGGRWRYDTRLGLTREFTHAELELAWTASAPERIPHPVQTRPGVAIGGRYFF